MGARLAGCDRRGNSENIYAPAGAYRNRTVRLRRRGSQTLGCSASLPGRQENRCPIGGPAAGATLSFSRVP